MSKNLLYPPAGGDPVKAHPSKVEEMKNSGWTESPKSTKTPNGKSTKKEVNTDG